MSSEPTDWYYYDGQNTQGPVARSALTALVGQYGPALQVRHQDQAQWYPVARVVGHVTPQAQTHQAPASKPKSRRGLVIGVGVFATLVLVVGGLVQSRRVATAAERSARQCEVAERVVRFADGVPVSDGVDEVERYLEGMPTEAFLAFKEGPLEEPFSDLNRSLGVLEDKMSKVAYYSGNRSGGAQLLPGARRDQREAIEKVAHAKEAFEGAVDDACP